MSNDDRDMEMENRLREALAATADGVQPGGDGLMRIQQRIGVRANRDRWLRPVLVLGSVVVVAVIAVGGVALARHGNGKASVTPLNSSPATSPTPEVSGFPAQGFFPFTTAAEEATWQQQFVSGGHSPWIADPVAVSQSWVPYYLSQKHVDEVVDKNVTDTTADVTLGRTLAGTSTVHAVVIVHLVKFDKAWIVTGASAPSGDLTIASPAPGATGNSPLTVTGPGFGGDQRASVEVRDAETPTLLGQAQTGMFGNGTQEWSATVSFSPSNDGYGVIVVSTDSPADGGVGELTAQKVTFTQASPAPGAPFYGVQGGVIERFGADGTPQGPVAGSDSHGTVTGVHQVAGTLYYTTGAANCATELRSMSVDGGTSTLVASADRGYGIFGFDISGDARSTYFEGGCGSNSGSGQLVMHDQAGKTRAIAFPSLPPVIAAGPVWEADGVHVDAFVRTGMAGYLARYDSTAGTDPMPTDNACSGYDVNSGLPGAVAAAPDGTLWFAVQTGTSMQVLSCDASGQPTTELTVNKNGTPVSLAVDSAGNILLADSDGHVWRGSAGGTATALSTQGGVSAVTW